MTSSDTPPTNGASPAPPLDPDAAFAAMLAKLRARSTDVDLAVVSKAWDVAKTAHAGQLRKSGEPYITHPLAVADILVDYGLDAAAIAAALMHDVVEDTVVESADLEAMFGGEVARLVRGVTKLSALEARELFADDAAPTAATKKAAAEAESLRRLLLASVDDLRVILIKMADRLHNMRTLAALSRRRRELMARETLEIYAPLANRLGMWMFKSQFEDLALEQLEPEAYALIGTVLADRREQHERYLADAMVALKERLESNGIEVIEIKARAKHIFSIYSKMVRKDLEADQILDILAIRVLVPSEADCYLGLGTVHAMWEPLGGEFDDYIARRKPNLYQSLHTSVAGPGNRPLEVQIRTPNMNEVAEYGVAAHWVYKENARLSADVQRQIADLRRTLESHDEDAADAMSFVEGLKTDVFRDQVYVFTPARKVIELRAGATPIDFAYHIHTEVGHRCRGAMVDGRMVPLDTPLETGQTVKIITAKGDNIGPSRDWANPSLKFTVSNHARAKIKQYFRRQIHVEAIKAGRDILERQLRKLGITRTKHEKVARLFDFARLEDFMAAVGRHEISSQAIVERLLEQESAAAEAAADRAESTPAHGIRNAAPPKPKATAGVTVFGADSLQSRIARCCNPLPGEPVVGYLTRGRGVTLHRTDCRNIAATREREPDRFIQVDWAQKNSQALPVELYIYAIDRAGLARDITDVIAKSDVNMTAIGAVSRDVDGMAVISTIVELESRAALGELIDRLEAVRNVIQVLRQRS